MSTGNIPAGNASADVGSSGAAFTRSARLLSAAEFSAVFKGRRAGRSRLFVLHALPSGGCAEARLGLVIGKRFAPLSVSRNTIRRVAREAFRLRRTSLPPADYVVRLHAAIGDVSLTSLKRQVRAELDTLFDRATR